VAIIRRLRDAAARAVTGGTPEEMEPGFIVPDDLPRDSLFQQPLLVDQLGVKAVEELEDGQVRVVFRAVVRDAVGKRCPDLAVTAEVAGPERTATGQGTTDLMGAILFRMVGPRGSYRIRIDDVAAGALELDRDGSSLELTTEA
jgi:hypothetical protein